MYQHESNLKSIMESRFIAYINSLLYYNSINYDKKVRKYWSKNCFIEANDWDDRLMADPRNNTAVYDQDIPFELELLDQISDDNLYREFNKLTNREKEILNLSVYYELSDTRIGRQLSISQQAVSKTRKNALNKLRRGITEHSGGV